MTECLTIAEAARDVRLSERTIRRALHDPHRPLRHYRPGRRVIICRADLHRWLEAHAAVPTISATALDRVSPAARELLAGLFDTPGAPTAGKPADNSPTSQSTPECRPPDCANGGAQP